MLVFKHFARRKNAGYKVHSLEWITSRTVPPTEFLIEDYWYYEQETGINLSVEIAASLDELFKKHKDNLEDDAQSFITDTLCECIKENYRFIAAIPVIDWKIAVMKKACTYFAKSFIKVYCEKDVNFDNYEKMNPYIDAAFRKLKDDHSNESDTSESSQDAMFIRNLLKLRLFSIFNQLLCHFFNGLLPADTHIFNCAEKCGLSYWVRFKIGQLVHPKPFAIEPDVLDRINRFSEYLYLLKNNKKPDYFTKLHSEMLRYEEEVMQSYSRIGNEYDLLIFCNEQNNFVKKYIEDVNYKLSNTSLRAIEQCGHSSRGSPKQQFVKIQAAIEAAIEAAKNNPPGNNAGG